MAEPELEEEMASASCEIGSLEMPSADWLFAAAASVQHSYGQVHPYLAAGLCVAGTLMNLVTVLVLTRPSMRSPVNVLLCAVACCDIVVEGSYLVFVLHFLLASAQRCEPADFSWGWALFMMFHAHASVIFHAASIWMTVSLAQIRVFTIRRATNGPGTPLITERFTAVLALFTTLAMAMVNLPNFLTFEIMEVPASAMLSCWQPPASTELPTTSLSLSTRSPELLAEKLQNFTTANGLGQSIEQQIENGSSHLISTLSPLLLGMDQLNRTRRHRLKRFRRDIGDIGSSTDQPFHWEMPAIEEPMVYTVRAHESDCMKLKLAFWSNGMIFKVIPCLLLTLSIVALLRIIADVAHKRKKLAQVMRKKVPKDHTTPMLVAILLIFLLTELPQGVCLVLNGIFSSESFHKRVYLPLGDLMDLLSLLNSAVGFLIYVGMSRKFRTVLLQLLFDAISCFLRAELCVLPLLKRVWPGGQNQLQPIKSATAGGGNRPNRSAPPDGASRLQHSLRRFQQRLTLEHEFSDTLKLLDQRRRSCDPATSRKRSAVNTPLLGAHPWSEKLASRKRLLEVDDGARRLLLAKRAMQLRSQSTDQYGALRARIPLKMAPIAVLKNGGASSSSVSHWTKPGLTMSGNKTPCAPGVPTNGGGESTGGGASTSKNWRRTSASCTAQHLLHSNGFQQQHSPERPSSSGTAANLLSKRGRDTGGGQRIKNKRAAQQSSSSSRKGKRAHKLGNSWMRWRPILLSSGGGQPTELTNRTEQLSLCPSSLLGLPSLTLAVSCSAGITAAAASVGVQLLHLDPPSGAHDQKQAHKRLPSSASCNLLLLAPPNLPNCFANRSEPFRRPSSENQLRDQHLGLLNIPQPNCSASADLLQVADIKRASFLSLGADQPTAADGRQRPPKRISFNLPPLDEHQRLAAEADAVERRRSMGPTGSDKNAGFGQRLRRSFLLSLGHRKGHSQHDGLSMMVGNAEFGGEEAEVQLGTPTQSNGIMAQNGHCFVAVANADSSNVNCPGKALLKLQSQGQGSQGQENCGSSGKSTFSSSALARALMKTLLGRQTAEESSATMRRRQSATGSAGSPQRRLCALRAETNFVGWAAYC